MTLQTITPPVFMGPAVLRDNTATTYTLDANSEYVAWIIQAPKTGTIDRIHFYATTVTANGDGLRCRIETVSGTNGNPSGTLVGGSSEVTHTTTTANSWNRGTAGLGAAVTKGDVIAVMLKSPAAGTTFNGIIRAKFDQFQSHGINWPNAVFPYIVNAIPTAAKVSPGGMCFAIEYDDGSIPYNLGAIPISTVTSTSFSSSSTPDERGNLFQVPVACRLIGFYSQAMPQAAANIDFVLYDSASSVLETLSVDAEVNRTTAGSPQSEARFFDTAIALSANTDYRLVVKPTTTTNVSVTQYVLDTSAGTTGLREAGVGGTTWKLTTRTDAGSWTDTNDTIACIGLIVDQLDDGAGGSQVGFPSSSRMGGVKQ